MSLNDAIELARLVTDVDNRRPLIYLCLMGGTMLYVTAIYLAITPKTGR